MEGEPKVKNIVALAEKVLPNTAPQGKDIIVRETDALRADWEAFVTALQKVIIHIRHSFFLKSIYIIYISPAKHTLWVLIRRASAKHTLWVLIRSTSVRCF